MHASLDERISDLFLNPPEKGYAAEHHRLFEEFKAALNRGEVRADGRPTEAAAAAAPDFRNYHLTGNS